MKRILTIFTLLLICLSLYACDNRKNAEDKGTSDQEVITSFPENTVVDCQVISFDSDVLTVHFVNISGKQLMYGERYTLYYRTAHGYEPVERLYQDFPLIAYWLNINESVTKDYIVLNEYGVLKNGEYLFSMNFWEDGTPFKTEAAYASFEILR